MLVLVLWLNETLMFTPNADSCIGHYSFSYGCLGAMNNNFLCNISLTYDNICYECYIMNSAFIAQSELIMNAVCKYSVALNISALILFMECKNLIVFRFLI